MKKLLFSVTLLLVTHLTLFPQAVTYKWLEEKNNLNEKGFVTNQCLKCLKCLECLKLISKD